MYIFHGLEIIFMDIYHLTYFIVAKYKSFTKVSKSLPFVKNDLSIHLYDLMNFKKGKILHSIYHFNHEKKECIP